MERFQSQSCFENSIYQFRKDHLMFNFCVLGFFDVKLMRISECGGIII